MPSTLGAREQGTLGMTIETRSRDSRPTPAPLPAVDERVLENLLKDIDDGTGDVRQDLIRSYLAEATEQVHELVEAAAAEDSGRVANLSHTLRSTSALLGATTLADVLGRIERHARDGSGGPLAPLAVTIRAEYDLVAAHLRG